MKSKIFVFLFFANFIKFCKNVTTQTKYVADYCLAASDCSGIPCSKYGNCYIDIFKYYNTSDTNKRTECKCTVGWTSLHDDKVKCCYQQKTQTFAFLLECTLGSGTGHFYMGNFYLGSLKFVVCLFLSCFICIFGFLHCYGEGEYSIEVTTHIKKTNRVSFYIFLFSIMLFIIGHVADLLLIGINFYLDGNGQQLAEW
jgi:hypothetical protein